MKILVAVIALFFATFGCYAADLTPEIKQAQSAVETIPFSQMKQWLGFDRADLDGIQVENGQLDFSSRFSYEDEHSLRWKYASGGSLTWHCKLDKLGKTPTFYFAALEPQRQRKTPSSFRLEFWMPTGASPAMRNSSWSTNSGIAASSDSPPVPPATAAGLKSVSRISSGTSLPVFPASASRRFRQTPANSFSAAGC